MVLSVRELSKTFSIHHLKREVVAFSGLNFDLQPAQFLLIQGPNGAGKSTLLRCLYRSYLPTSGKALYQLRGISLDLARIADEDIAWLRLHQIGYVAQFLRPRPRVTALELVAEPLLQDGITPDVAWSKASQLLETFGLKPELWQAYPSTFSGGEQQKVNLARALIKPRQLLLLDEPTASLDVSARAALATRLSDLKNQGVAMIGVFHHPEDVEGLVDERIQIKALGPEREKVHVAD